MHNRAEAATCAALALATAAFGCDPSAPDLVARALARMGGAEEIVFAERDLSDAYQYYATFGRYSDEEKFIHPPDGSRLCALNLRTRRVRVLLDDPGGGIRDPRVHYDGARILFAYRRADTHHYNLHEIGSDGAGLRRLTSGEWDDVDPEYLPDGGIVFASARCRRFIPCNRVQTAVLHRIDADGRNLRPLSANVLLEDRPAVLPDGRIVYTRWDYLDRATETFRDLWVMNPDGTGQMVLFGGTARPYPEFYAKCDALPIPGTRGKLVSVFSPAFGHRENAGNVMVVDLRSGPDDWTSARQVSPTLPNLVWTIGSGHGREGFRDPYPLSEDCFLVAQDCSLLILDANGRTEEIHRAAKMVHDPRVIRPRPREPVLPQRGDARSATAHLFLADVHEGRNMAGVAPGTVKKLLVLEDLPKPASQHGWRGEHGGHFTLRRVLGEVPVEPDGSSSFEVPALRALYFVALDARGLAVKRMQSFTTLMPGETQGCVGCHESRTRTIHPGARMALRRRPSRIERVPGAPEVFDYRRDIQPIWDAHCVGCHSAERAAGRVVLTGDNTEWRTQSYDALHARDQISRPSGWAENGNHPPYGFGTGASPLMRKIDGSHHGVRLAPPEYDRVRLWIETSAIFAGTYAACNPFENAVATPLIVSKTTLGQPVDAIAARRCLPCHGSVAHLGPRRREQRDDRRTDGKPPEWLNNPLYCLTLYNLSRPDKSMILQAPLAAEAGGYGWCKPKADHTAPVFADASDPDYLEILRAISAAQARQQAVGKPGQPNFRPGAHYVRWMKRFGILPATFDANRDPIDVYATDAAYWRSFWHPATVE